MAKYDVSLDQESSPKGTLIEVPPIGVIENGGSVTCELTKEQAEELKSAYGVTVKMERGGDK